MKSGSLRAMPGPPKFTEVCGTSSDRPIAVGAKVAGSDLLITLGTARPTRVIVRLTGLRRGFANARFPDRTRAQFEANERFLRSAYEQ